MKKYVLISLLLVPCVLFFALNGCGQTGGGTDVTTTTTASTTTTTNAGNSDAVKIQAASAGLIAKGSSSIGALAGSMGSTVASVSSVKAFSTSTMPDQFWTVDLASSTEAWVPVTFGGSMASIISPKMRFWTRDSKQLYGATLSSSEAQTIKIFKLASFEAGSTQAKAMFTDSSWVSGEVTKWAGGPITDYVSAHQSSATGIYSSAECYFQSITTIGEYILWVAVLPTFPTTGLPAGVGYSTPEVEKDAIIHGLATIEISAVFNAPITGEATFNVACDPTDAGGKPAAGTVTSQSTMLTPAGTLDATVSMTFSSAGAFTGIGFSGTTTPEGNTIYASMNSAGTSGTIIMSNEAGATLGTGEVSDTGITWYPEGLATSEVITWSDI